MIRKTLNRIKNALLKMNAYEKSSLILESLGFALVLLSICLLNQQTKSQVDGLRSSSYAAVADKQLEIHKIFLSNPELRIYFEDNLELNEDSENYNKVISIADYHLDFFDLLWEQGDNFLFLNKDKEAWHSWQIYIGETFNTSPALCQRIKDVYGWYEDGFVKFIDESIQEYLKKKEYAEGEKLNCTLEGFYEKKDKG